MPCSRFPRQAGGLGANICHQGTAYLTLGTSVISGSFSEQFVVNPAFRTMYGGVPGSCLLETVLLGGTYTLDWLLTTFLGKNGAETIGKASSAAVTGSDAMCGDSQRGCRERRLSAAVERCPDARSAVWRRFGRAASSSIRGMASTSSFIFVKYSTWVCVIP